MKREYYDLNGIRNSSGPLEFRKGDVEYPEGWYFLDELRDLHGPFVDIIEAAEGFRLYTRGK